MQWDARELRVDEGESEVAVRGIVEDVYAVVHCIKILWVVVGHRCKFVAASRQWHSQAASIVEHRCIVCACKQFQGVTMDYVCECNMLHSDANMSCECNWCVNGV